MDEDLDTGDILVQEQMLFDEDEETFKSSYDKLQEKIMDLFKINWSLIKAGKITAHKQEGKGSYHTMKDLEEIKNNSPFSWDEKISLVRKRMEK